MDRKRLAREYKEARRPAGVFRVLNTINGKSLVGSSVDVPSRLNREKAQLTLNAHSNPALQRDWLELGAGAFQFEVLDLLPPSDEPGYDPTADLRVLEQLWLEKLAPFGERGYHASGPDEA